ncbi:MAG: hypothetical protein HC915_18500 [Anaerolineae bacterium]|nr:hypothetical protein [Anaerolineae bacterium]
MSTLKAVLTAFQASEYPLSTRQIARRLDLEPALLDEMIAFWVRKGRLREVSACSSACGTCAPGGAACPFVLEMPRRYEGVP